MMKKKDVTFIVILTLIAAFVWIAVEVLLWWQHWSGGAILAWRIFVVVITCIISVWHAFREEKEAEKKKSERAKKYTRRRKR